MVTRPGRHAHVRESAFGGDRGDDRLRAVAAGHAYGVGAVGDRVAHERREVIAEVQLDRLHATSACLARDLEALCLAAARFRVIEQHRPLRRHRDWEPRVDGEHGARGREREHQPRQDQHILEHAALEHDQHDRAGEQHASSSGGGVARRTSMHQRPPRRHQPNHQTREHGQATRESLHADDHRQDNGRRQQNKRRDCSHPPTHHVTDL